MKKLIYVFISIFCLLFLLGCTEQNQPENITVKYVTDYIIENGEIHIIEFVEESVSPGKLIFPEVLLRENDEITNAYYIKNGEEDFSVWSFEENVANEDIVIYLEINRKYKVSFLDKNLSPDTVKIVSEDEYLEKIVIDNEEYKIDKWYYDEELTKLVEFPLKVTEDCCLYPEVIYKYSLTFLDKDGNAIKTETYLENQEAQDFYYQTDGYTVLNWYFDNELTQLVNFPILLNENTTLYPKVLNKYTVTYLGDDDTVIHKETVYENHPIPYLTCHTETYKVINWYYDSDLTIKLGEDDIISGDLTLYPEIEYACIVSVNNMNGSPIKYIYVFKNNKIMSVQLKEPKLDNCNFLGWYTDSEFTQKFDPSEDAVVEAITLYAKFLEYKYRVDEREAQFILWSSNDQEVDRYTSLYAAINDSVDRKLIGSYVTTSNSSSKLFVNDEYYEVSNRDMFWYYSDVTVKSRYTGWQSSYWNDVKNTDEICIFKNSLSGILEQYANGHSVIMQGTQSDSNEDSKENYCWLLETNATVNVQKNSGITEQIYSLALSEARIYPNYSGNDSVYAYVGFNTIGDYNSSHVGLKCDVKTGNWYYYSGEASCNYNNIKTDFSKVIMTSTWDNELGCFIPDQDITIKIQLFQGQHRLTIIEEDGTKIVKDYFLSPLTQCNTIRFTCGMDIEAKKFPDYMCGAKFENLVITSAKGIVYQEIISDPEKYYNPSIITTAGEYDLLNSNPASIARYQTLIYTPSCVSYNFENPGRDVYSFSFDF